MNRQCPQGGSLSSNNYEVDLSEPNPCRPSTTLTDDTCRHDSIPAYHSAVAILQEYDDVKVLAWVQLLRSLTPDFEHTTCSGNLSAQQLDAVATLRSCPDQTMITLLEKMRREASTECRISGNLPHSTTYSASPATERGEQYEVDGYGHVESSGRAGGDGARLIGTAARTQQSQARTGSQTRPFKGRAWSRHGSCTAVLGTQEPTYWCTVCTNPAPITTCDGWKRHEKEQHEKGFVCMPDGPVEDTEAGRRCVFCGLLNPNQKHLDTHGVALCTGKSVKDRRFTRRFQLVKHLEVHGIFNGTILADSWQTKVRNRYYSCGFCVALFVSHSDKLSHVDACHFRRFQSIDEWNPNMVIRGLLLQPAVFEAWILLSTYDVRSEDLVWEPHVAINLRPRLEVSDEPAEMLAADAFDQARFAMTDSHQALAPLYGAEGSSVAAYNEELFGSNQQTQMQDIDTSSEAYPATVFAESSHMEVPDLQWNKTTFEPMDLDFMGLHPPQVQTDYSYADPVLTSSPNDATPNSTSLSRTFMEDPIEAQTSQQNSYADPDLEAIKSCYSFAPSQTQPSTLASCYSPSLMSTNTSIHSLSASLPSRQRITPPEANPQQQPTYVSKRPENPVDANHTGHRKSASFVAQLRHKLSRAKSRDVNTTANVPMDIDVYDMMRIMEHDPRARARADSKHETILYGEAPGRTMR